MNKKHPLKNAWELNKQNPKTFELPNFGEIENIKKGSYLLVCSHKERFWVKVIIIYPNGTANAKIEQSDMAFGDIHGHNHNDIIIIQPYNIYKVLNKPILN